MLAGFLKVKFPPNQIPFQSSPSPLNPVLTVLTDSAVLPPHRSVSRKPAGFDWSQNTPLLPPPEQETDSLTGRFSPLSVGAVFRAAAGPGQVLSARVWTVTGGPRGF
ncbi:hypothetical protein FQA47_016158 [Oryzias melastigma]|uniref:Uncharacterized protein n=1 Tax=Oryzias melastigma TaxID=30732 RepID=A0A834FU15_ORYME|nr:hypothetical protein FQA47_016158 [Oryzias melastigma]